MYLNRADVSRAAMGRLPSYLKFLRGLDYSKNRNISSTAIARGLGLGDVQVRKDLCAVSGAGKPKVGYDTQELIRSIESFLGYSDPRCAVIIGAGKLGMAILDYKGFSEYGLKICAAFDVCVKEPLQSQGGQPVYPMNDFERYCSEHPVSIAVLTVPDTSAQKCADIAVKNNINAIWSFSSQRLCVPKNVTVQYENIALSLAHLSKQISNV